MSITSIVYEGGESVRVNKNAIDYGVIGIIKVMTALKMIDYPNSLPQKVSVELKNSDWLRASKSGIFIWSKKSGDAVKTGDILGVIKDPYGTNSIEVISKLTGYIIGHNNAAVVNQGDPLFHIGTI
jgi:hypothetical protein